MLREPLAAPIARVMWTTSELANATFKFRIARRSADRFAREGLKLVNHPSNEKAEQSAAKSDGLRKGRQRLTAAAGHVGLAVCERHSDVVGRVARAKAQQNTALLLLRAEGSAFRQRRSRRSTTTRRAGSSATRRRWRLSTPTRSRTATSTTSCSRASNGTMTTTPSRS
jgi:hypothetical protein